MLKRAGRPKDKCPEKMPQNHFARGIKTFRQFDFLRLVKVSSEITGRRAVIAEASSAGGDTVTHSKTTEHETQSKPVCKYLREPEVLARVPFSKPTLHRLCKEGRFPRPVKVGPRAVAWLTAEIDDWDAQLIAARDDAATAA
jgi:prophage regulatory protein